MNAKILTWLMSNNAPASARREVSYTNIDEFQADAERLAKLEVRTVGKWTYPQILDHLTRTMIASLDGFGFRAPWFARALIAPFMKNSLLTRKMKPGFNLPRRAAAILPGPALSLEAAMENLRKALTRYENEPQRAEHPFLGKLASQEFTALHLRHSELHMSFVLPEGN